MANIFENKERHVIPNWRSFENTAKLGELNGSKTIQLDSSFKPDISDLLEDWKGNKNIGVAGDILGVAIVCNQQKNKVVKEVSKFVLDQTDGVTPALIRAANSINLNKKEKIDFPFEIKNIQTFTFRENMAILFQRIKWYKKRLIQNPNNPIAWVELSRLYSINGQEEQAEKAMKNALFLAPENRFVLRNMARFFVHIGDIDFAHEIIRKSTITKHDPWVMATEIALADLRGRGSKFAKKGIQLIDSNSFHPFNITELSSSLGTLELSSSSIKKSKNLFKKSLISPNDNSLAQAEWASQKESSLMRIDPSKFNVTNSFEAMARDAKVNQNWDKAIEYSKDWFLDLPFSKGGILFGSEVARTKLKDHTKAIEISKLGLISHPNDHQLLNNIVYSLCLENKLVEAEKHFNKIRINQLEDSDINKVCITATKGLLHFRKGQSEIGRKYYMDAMQLAKELNNSNLSSLAFVNYSREEILRNEEDTSQLIPKLLEIKKNTINIDISTLVDEVIDLKNKKTNTQHRI